jgi:hypothetical protein
MSAAIRNSLSIKTDMSNGNNDPLVAFVDKAAMMLANKLESRGRGCDEGEAQPSLSTVWGSAIKREKFQDMDLLESGNAREYIAEESLSPTSAKEWTYSTVYRINKTQYKYFIPLHFALTTYARFPFVTFCRMFSNKDRFLLSAKQHNGIFYISQYEHFGDAEIEEAPISHYCAVLK